MTHDDVELALVRLNDALCSLERDAGPGSTLVLIPHDGRLSLRLSLDGKPVTLHGTAGSQDLAMRDLIEQMTRYAFATRGTTPNEGQSILLDLLARTIPALSMVIDLADTDAHRESRRALLNEVEQAVGPDRIKALLLNGDAHFVPSKRVEWEHLNANGQPCQLSRARWDAGQAIVLRSSFLACPECGIVIKDRNGRRGEYDRDFIWRGRLNRYAELEFEFTCARNTYVRVHGEGWQDTSVQMHADILAHLRQFIQAPGDNQ
jgi:hypothetical protein